MIIMRKKSVMKIRFKILILFVISVYFYNEIFIYNLKRNQWSYLPCYSNNCTRFLLVADPQLLGESFDKAIYNSIAIWDSDRFLKSTFQQALYFSKPDVICFLGDLFDEGSAANDEEYNRYKIRFQSIFSTFRKREKIYIPGDNDIGGENGDRITQKKIDRFRGVFTGFNIIEQNNVKIYKLNRITYEIPKEEETSINFEGFRVGISHFSILIAPGTYSKIVMERIKPHIIFSAHMHDSVKIHSRNLQHTKIQKSYLLKDAKVDVINLNSNEFVYEIMVPTCSYRMGALNIGYGVAVIDDNKLYYTVLWMPNRFYQLFIYIICIVVSFFILVLPTIFNINLVKLFRRNQKVKITESLNNDV